MSETRYLIGKVIKGHTIENVVDILNASITESELKRRFIEATQTIKTDPETGEMANWHEVLGVLLLDEEKEQSMMNETKPLSDAEKAYLAEGYIKL